MKRMGMELNGDKTSVLDIKEELDWVDGFDDEPRHDKVMVGDWLDPPHPPLINWAPSSFSDSLHIQYIYDMLHCNNIHE